MLRSYQIQLTAACSGPKLVCDANDFISAIFEISSILAETEKRRFKPANSCNINTNSNKSGDKARCMLMLRHTFKLS